MEKTQTNNSKIFKELVKWMIIVSAITLALVLVVVVLTFILAFNILSPVVVNVVTAAFIVLAIVEIICDVGLIVLISITLAFAAKAKGPEAKSYIITFAILLGLFVIFWLVGIFVNAVATLQLLDVLLILIFASINYAKLKTIK